jgi:hypothetical protein
MQRKEPMKEILADSKEFWDRPELRSAVRTNFKKVLACRTSALGSNVYASASEEKVVHHTCKSRACSSCGHRATRLWQRQMWAALPEVPFAGVVFTMPDVLWSIFRDNRHLLGDLPSLGAAVLQQWAKDRLGIRLMIMVVPHTFGRHLNFNPHLHALVSTSGLRTNDGMWVSDLRLDREAFMMRWRYAVIIYLIAALEDGFLLSEAPPSELRAMFDLQRSRWWNVNVQPCMSKEHFLQYAGRYVRRPPLAQYRILDHDAKQVRFRTSDHRLKKEVTTCYTLQEFTRLLADQVPDHYRHAVRHFGLLASRVRRQTFGTIFALLGQKRRPRPHHLSWARSIEQAFKVNPLVDSRGELMRLVRRESATVAAQNRWQFTGD